MAMLGNGLGMGKARRSRLRSAVGSGVLLGLALAALVSMLAASPASAAIPSDPGANVFGNPGFETGSLSSWVVDGTNPTPTVTTTNPHTGTYSALVGTLSGPEPLGDGSFYQQITIPAGASVLNFFIWPQTADTVTFDWQDVAITNTSGTVLATLIHTADNSQTWLSKSFDLSAFIGQTVRLRFLVHQDGFGDDTAMYVDDVCLSQPTHTLTVAKTGSGSGTVSSSPTGIDCGPTCSAKFAEGASVTL